MVHSSYIVPTQACGVSDEVLDAKLLEVMILTYVYDTSDTDALG